MRAKGATGAGPRVPAASMGMGRRSRGAPAASPGWPVLPACSLSPWVTWAGEWRSLCCQWRPGGLSGGAPRLVATAQSQHPRVPCSRLVPICSFHESSRFVSPLASGGHQVSCDGNSGRTLQAFGFSWLGFMAFAPRAASSDPLPHPLLPPLKGLGAKSPEVPTAPEWGTPALVHTRLSPAQPPLPRGWGQPLAVTLHPVLTPSGARTPTTTSVWGRTLSNVAVSQTSPSFRRPLGRYPNPWRRAQRPLLAPGCALPLPPRPLHP